MALQDQAGDETCGEAGLPDVDLVLVNGSFWTGEPQVLAGKPTRALASAESCSFATQILALGTAPIIP